MAGSARWFRVRHLHGHGARESHQVVRRGRSARQDLLRDERQGDREPGRAEVLRLRRGQIRGGNITLRVFMKNFFF